MGKERREGGRDGEGRPRATLVPASSKNLLNDFYLYPPVEAACLRPSTALVSPGQGVPPPAGGSTEGHPGAGSQAVTWENALDTTSEGTLRFKEKD